MNVFWSRGYHGTSMQELCAAMDLNRKSLYAEFGGKAALFEEALALYTQLGIEQSRVALTMEPLGVENIRRYFSAMTYEANCRGCLMTMTINERSLVPESSLQEVSSALGEIEELLRKNLLAEGYNQAIADRLTTFLIFSIQGITTMGKLEGDNARLRQVIETILGALALEAISQIPQAS